VNGLLSKPIITTQPSSPSSVNAGDNVTLSVVASGGSLHYRWWKTGTKENPPGKVNDSSYSFPVKEETAGTYYVRVSNDAGEVTSSYVSVYISKPVIKKQPSLPSGAIKIGDEITLEVVGEGRDLHYSWSKDSARIDGAKSFKYTFVVTADSLEKRYRVLIENYLGNVESAPVTIRLKDK
jgi:hypothetical protein